MKASVISDNFLEQIADRKVVAAVFTTYTFEPEFFELEVIPLLLKQDVPYSYDDQVKHFLVSDNLREADLQIEVFYDLPMVRQQADKSPGMEYLFHGVNLGNRAFHGKINLILLHDEATNKESLLLGTGSNNLTRAGWWDNIECQHWVEISNKSMPKHIMRSVKDEVFYLKNKQSYAQYSKNTAIDIIDEFLNTCKAINSSTCDDQYFGLYLSDERKSFLQFLSSKSSPIQKYQNWTLEIISPFFADDPQNEQHKELLEMGVKEIKLLLPFDDEKVALCQQAYFKNIENEEKVHWAKWKGELNRMLGVDGDHFRRLHAKIYHFYNKKQSWIFVGSVNYTYKAMNENAEAGFLTRLTINEPLLEIRNDTEVERFSELEDEILPGSNDVDKDMALPELHISYDWVTKSLTGRTCNNRAYEIEILSAENSPVISKWNIASKQTTYCGDINYIEEALKNGSLVRVRGIGTIRGSNSIFPEHEIMILQVGWSHKPQVLPNLSAEQILAIYAGMDTEKRKMMLINAKIRALVLGSQAGELIYEKDNESVEQFFSEYAELFNAFRKLRKQLEADLEEERYSQVDYYLTGTSVDSIKTLVNMALNESKENSLNAVSRYLILLSAFEIYSLKQFIKRPNVSDERNQLSKNIAQYKKSSFITLANNTPKNRKKFFDWFETEYFRVYKKVGSD